MPKFLAKGGELDNLTGELRAVYSVRFCLRKQDVLPAKVMDMEVKLK